jgi:hypothetical protein
MASKSTLRVVDGGKCRVREIPLNGPTHQMFKSAVLPLDTLRELDVFKDGLRLVMAIIDTRGLLRGRQRPVSRDP